MLADDGRSLQIDLVGGCWAIPASDIPGSRESGASAPIERAPPQVSGAYRFLECRQDGVRWSLRAGAPNVLDALKIVKPDTVIRWHRAGFRSYWRWKSRARGGRPSTAPDIRQLIREMSIANPLWGAPRIHGELLKLGIEVGQTTVAKYMAKRRRPPSQGWKTFLYNHADGIA
jgi:hypothetical protein